MAPDIGLFPGGVYPTTGAVVLAKLNFRKIDRYDKRFGHGFSVRLPWENPAAGRNFDALNVDISANVMGPRRVAGDLDVVVVSFEEPLVVHIKRLDRAMGRNFGGERDL